MFSYMFEKSEGSDESYDQLVSWAKTNKNYYTYSVENNIPILKKEIIRHTDHYKNLISAIIQKNVLNCDLHELTEEQLNKKIPALPTNEVGTAMFSFGRLLIRDNIDINGSVISNILQYYETPNCFAKLISTGKVSFDDNNLLLYAGRNTKNTSIFSYICDSLFSFLKDKEEDYILKYFNSFSSLSDLTEYNIIQNIDIYPFTEENFITFMKLLDRLNSIPRLENIEENFINTRKISEYPYGNFVMIAVLVSKGLKIDKDFLDRISNCNSLYSCILYQFLKGVYAERNERNGAVDAGFYKRIIKKSGRRKLSGKSGRRKESKKSGRRKTVKSGRRKSRKL